MTPQQDLPRRALVCSDDADLSDLLVRLLARAGFEARAAARPLSVVEKGPLPDLVVWDTSRLTKKASDELSLVHDALTGTTRLVVLSSWPCAEDEAAARAAGADAYLPKPFSGADLLAVTRASRATVAARASAHAASAAARGRIGALRDRTGLPAAISSH